MEGRQALDYVLSLAREHRVRDADCMLAREESITVKVFRGKVEKVDQSTALGLGVRVVDAGRTGLAFTERLEPAALEKTFLAARENAALLDPTEVVLNREIPPVPDPAGLGLHSEALQALTVDDLGRLGLEIEAAAFAADRRVKALPYLVASRSQGEYRIVSTHGLEYAQRENSVGAYCQALLEDNGRRKSGSRLWHRRAWSAEEARTVGPMAVERAAALLGAGPIPSARLPVVLDEDCAPELLGMYFGAFSGEAAQKGQSRLKGRLGEQIAAPEIDLVDEPHLSGAGGSRYLDAEGTPTRPLPLIEGGRFANFLYHIESARRDGRPPTGHAGRSYSGGIVTRKNNLVLPAGTHTLEELIALEPRCLLVTELEGGAGCNPISGDISIGVQGFLVEGGRRVQPVDGVTIAGNFFDLLRGIRARGRAYQPNLTSLFIPALLVDGLAVSG